MPSISQLFYRNIVKIHRGNYFYCLGRIRLCQLTIKGKNNIVNILHIERVFSLLAYCSFRIRRNSDIFLDWLSDPESDYLNLLMIH